MVVTSQEDADTRAVPGNDNLEFRGCPSEDNIQCWKSRCQEAVRRPLIKLQQVSEASC